MPTRAAAAAAAAANMRTTRSRKVSTQLKGKENGPPSSTTRPKEKHAPRKTARIVKAMKVDKVFCSCRGVDDGTPMVQCGTCNEWYHFGCVQLSEDDASEIMVYVCPTCQEKTGRRTVSKCQKTTQARQLHYPFFSFPYFCTLSTCNNPHLRCWYPCSLQYVLVLVRCHCTSLSCMCPTRAAASCIHPV
jgi:hypothetical protein